MSNNKTLKVFSSTAIAGMIAAAMMSSQAFAAVDAYSVKVGDAVYKYDKSELEKSFLDSKAGEKSALYEDFTKKLAEAKGFYAFNDTKNGEVDYSSIEAKFLEAKGAGQKFDVDAFTESKDAKVVAPKVVKKAVVKDGTVVYVDETPVNPDETELKVTSVEPLSLKQVKINFNKAVTNEDKKDDVEDVDNYTLKDKDNSEITDAIKEVKLDDDKKSATLTFNDKKDSSYKGIDNYIIENQESYKLIIDEDITGELVKETLKFTDTTLPKVDDISVIGIDTIKVKFSEPVMPWNIKDVSSALDKDKKVVPELDKEDFNIVDSNDDDLNIRKVELVDNNREANIILSSDLKDKEKVKVKVKASVRDYAGLSVIAGDPKTIETKKDTKAPRVVDFKDAKDDEVTLIFDKDIKVKDSDSNIISGSDLEKIYHASDIEANWAEEASIDGKELKIKFKEDSLGNGPTNIYIKSGLIESRWEVENDKISHRITKGDDTQKPEITKVEQDEDANDKIKVKFSKKVKCTDGSENEDESALNTSNYTLKDSDGREWSIKRIEKDGTGEKKFIIKTVKDLDDDKEYTLEVKNIEDKNGNAIEKTKKKFKAVDNDAVKQEDIKVKVYSVGTSDQKIVIDFDSTMKDDKSEFSAKDLSKYTLVSTDKKEFDGKDSINLSQVYRSNIKMSKEGKAVEISIPGKKKTDDLHDKQYNLSSDKDRYTLQINRVSDKNGNVTDKNYTVPVTVYGENTAGITFDTNSDYVPQMISLDQIRFSFNDKVDFNEDDIVVVAANDEDEARKLAGYQKKDGKHTVWNKDSKQTDSEKGTKAGVLKLAKSKPTKNDDGNTQVLLTLDKELKDKRYDDDNNNHIFTSNGKFVLRDEEGISKERIDKTGKIKSDNELSVYVVVVPSKKVSDDKWVTKTDNDYNQTLTLGIKEVEDKLAPSIVDNDVMSDKKDKADKYIYKYQEKNNNDKAVEYWYDGTSNTGAIVLTFEEEIDPASVSTSSFELNKDDFKDAKIQSTEVAGNKITINIVDLFDKSKEGKADYKKEIEQGSRLTLRSIKDTENNELNNLNLEVGKFDELTAEKDVVLKNRAEKVAVDAINAGNGTVENFTTLGVKDVTEGNLEAVKAAVVVAKAGKEINKDAIVVAANKAVKEEAEKAAAKAKEKAAIDEVNKGNGTVDSFKTLGVKDVTDENLEAVKAEVVVAKAGKEIDKDAIVAAANKAIAQHKDATLKTLTIGEKNVLSLENITESGATATFSDFSGDAVKGIVVASNSGKAKVVVKVKNVEVNSSDLATKVLAENDVVTVEVTAADGTTKKTYKITLTK
ncbi:MULTISPECIES: cadherin-like beta sandwich domain-containing protein [Clostridium]|uniref:cadherin-like beta sandwich domain-containing protein n=1 Tax=Clostridium TaxID=1485 RepID=UPI00069D4040|nr:MULTISPECIES: cadherin-like beta sandwich domain-containing protein [Clostridium]